MLDAGPQIDHTLYSPVYCQTDKARVSRRSAPESPAPTGNFYNLFAFGARPLGENSRKIADLAGFGRFRRYLASAGARITAYILVVQQEPA